ncbi:MAG: response regulator transcription factor [Ruminiclostridium sp.]|nr:response regulator transcription factor [Ruminiclostridium sp.]
MRIAVCDDETAVLKLVSVFIRTEFENRREPVTVSSYTSAVRLISDLETKQFDAVFLDIRMPEMDGFRAAEELRKNAPEAKIIFITTEDDLVYDSFDFQPFAFIPKTPPELMKSRLSRTVDNLLAACNAVRKICIELPYNDKIYLRPDELIYVNSEKNNLIYHTKENGDIITRAKIQDAEEILPSEIFVRIHNRIIVNMSHITNLEYTHASLTVTGGEELGISRTRKTEFEAAYDDYLRKKA